MLLAVKREERIVELVLNEVIDESPEGRVNPSSPITDVHRVQLNKR